MLMGVNIQTPDSMGAGADGGASSSAPKNACPAAGGLEPARGSPGERACVVSSADEHPCCLL